MQCSIKDYLMEAMPPIRQRTNACEASKKVAEGPCLFPAPPLTMRKELKVSSGGGGLSTCKRADMCTFFQMKMHMNTSAKQILDWTKKADDRAEELGFEAGSCVIQLFVTGTIEANTKDHQVSWPKNCMVVFGTEAKR